MTPVFLNPPSSSFSIVEKKINEDQHLKLFISSPCQASSSHLSSPCFFDSVQDQRESTTVHHVLESKQRDPKVDNTPTQQEGSNTNNRVLIQSSASSHNPHVIVDSTPSQKLSTGATQRSSEDNNSNINDGSDDYKDHISSNSKLIKNGTTSVKWMSSKMRLMQKMSNNPETPAVTSSTTTNNNHQLRQLYHKPAEEKKTTHNTKVQPLHQDNNSTTLLRVCSDCNTTSTPLWRSGPRGPKSLCNACGIRQRKARRAMAEAAAAAANGVDQNNHHHHQYSSIRTSSSTKTQCHNLKEKKYWRGNINNHSVSHHKNKHSKLLGNSTASTTSTSTSTTSSSSNNSSSSNSIKSQDNDKLCFKTLSFGELNDNNYSAFRAGVFPQDVAEAAVLLMELSNCGFVHYS